MFRRWLISSRNEKKTTELEAYKDLSNSNPGERICLIGEGTLGANASPTQYVYADLISMPSRGQNTTQYAWWVGGENQKAKITIEDVEPTSDPVTALRRTWDTPTPSFVGSVLYEELAEPISDNAKLLTLQTLPLANKASRSAGAPYFFDITTSSYTLPTNIRMGGLKQDLSLLLNKEGLAGTEFARRTAQDAPIVEQGGEVAESKTRDKPIGSWQNLHAYHNTWPKGDSTTNAFHGRLVGNLNTAYTRMSGSALPMNEEEHILDTNSTAESDYDIKTLLDEGSKTAGYARWPVLLSYMKSFFMYTEPNDNGTYKLSVGYTPVVLWWNPYNVEMRIPGKKLWVHTIPYKTMWLQSWSQHSDGLPHRWTNYCMIQPYNPDPNNLSAGANGTAYDIAQSFGEDYGQYFIKTEGNESADIVFAPGEILIFSPSNGTAAGSDGSGGVTGAFENPFYNEYDPKTTSGLKAYFYSQETAERLANRVRPLNLRFGAHNDPSRGNTPILIDNRNLGYFFAGSREMLTFRVGYMGLHKADRSSDAIGKYLNSPQRYTLGWYDPDTTTEDLDIMNMDYWTTSMNDVDQPYYVAAVGIVPKSANGTLRTRFSQGDYRTKSWQYSSPAFFGSRLAEPDEQMRTYHPYQLVNIEVGGGLTTAPLDSINGRGFYGVSSDGEQVSLISSQEVAMHPPFSLAGYNGMRLLPGWFKGTQRTVFDGGSSNLVRQQYQSGVPAVGIGNSFADPALPADDTHVVFNNNYPLIYGQEQIFDDYYDHGLLINDALWDRFFTSSVSDMPSASGTIDARTTLTEFLNDENPLPVSRHVKADNPYSNDAIIERVMAEDGWKYIAQFLMVDGGFNVNSTSVEAWAATLRGLSKRQLVSNVNGKLSFVEEGKNETDVLFSRFMVSTTDKSIDSLGGYSMMRGSTDLRNGDGLLAAWGEVRKLDNNSIQELAERIVEQVRERGPFLSMSDFINRRLDASNTEHALSGALQAAIDKTSINENFNEVMVDQKIEGRLYKFPEAALGSIHTAAPGYLIQSDVLMSLSNILTLRDDTFVVRSYGCVRNSKDAILAQAWCEAIVQRSIEYVDPTNNPYESERNPDGSKSSDSFSDMNKVMGRKLKVVSFRWLDHWDI